LNLTDVAPVKFVPVIVTDVPGAPLLGLKLEIVGEFVIVKLVSEVAVPFSVVTVILPAVVLFATTAVICVSLSTVKLAAAVVLKRTTVAPVKFVPVIVTEFPATPPVGLKLEIVGALRIVKFVDDAAVPLGVPTRILPVVVPAATVAVIWVALSTEKLAAGLLLKVSAVAPLKFVPVIVTAVPVTPDAGVKLEMVGAAGGGGVLLELALPQASVATVSRVAKTA